MAITGVTMKDEVNYPFKVVQFFRPCEINEIASTSMCFRSLIHYNSPRTLPLRRFFPRVHYLRFPFAALVVPTFVS
jgi:hypothetical protein